MGDHQSIEIFRAGRHITAAGDRIEFSDADLQACVAAYDPALHEAPIVVGHPKDNGPAYGWVAGMSLDGGLLKADPRQVEPAFAEMVGAGRFKKVSASFYSPDSPNNPAPGVWYLRHVGFLGAQPPAIKGLRDAAFADGEAGVVEFADWDDMANAGLWRRMREWLIGKFGQDVADQVVPGYAVDQLQVSAATETDDETASPVSSFSERPRSTPTTEESLMAGNAPAAQAAAKTAEFAERERGLAEREAAIAKREAEARDAEFATFCEARVREGHLTPALATIARTLARGITPESKTVEFGEGGARTDRPMADVLREFLQAMPKQVEFREVAPAGDVKTLDVTDANAITREAQNFQEAERKNGRDIPITVAVAHVMAQHEGTAQ